MTVRISRNDSQYVAHAQRMHILNVGGPGPLLRGCNAQGLSGGMDRPKGVYPTEHVWVRHNHGVHGVDDSSFHSVNVD